MAENRRNGHDTKLTPVYLDEVNGIVSVNKITYAAGDPDREITVLLKPHIGEAGRQKDIDLMAFVFEMQAKVEAKEYESENDFFLKNPKIVMKMADNILDFDTEEGSEIKKNLTLFEVINAFERGLAYRTNQLHNQAVQQAVKKLKGEHESQKAENGTIHSLSSETTGSLESISA